MLRLSLSILLLCLFYNQEVSSIEKHRKTFKFNIPGEKVGKIVKDKNFYYISCGSDNNCTAYRAKNIFNQTDDVKICKFQIKSGFDMDRVSVPEPFDVDHIVMADINEIVIVNFADCTYNQSNLYLDDLARREKVLESIFATVNTSEIFAGDFQLFFKSKHCNNTLCPLLGVDSRGSNYKYAIALLNPNLKKVRKLAEEIDATNAKSNDSDVNLITFYILNKNGELRVADSSANLLEFMIASGAYNRLVVLSSTRPDQYILSRYNERGIRKPTYYTFNKVQWVFLGLHNLPDGGYLFLSTPHPRTVKQGYRNPEGITDNESVYNLMKVNVNDEKVGMLKWSTEFGYRANGSYVDPQIFGLYEDESNGYCFSWLNHVRRNDEQEVEVIAECLKLNEIPELTPVKRSGELEF